MRRRKKKDPDDADDDAAQLAAFEATKVEHKIIHMHKAERSVSQFNECFS